MKLKRLVTMGILGGAWVPLLATEASAQEVDRVSAPNAVGVGAAKGIVQQLGSGAGSDTAFGSSRYLIARDPARAIRRGRNLFQRKFKVSEGSGPRTNDGNGDINTIGSIGAGLADSCALCHGRPRGSAGFGGDVFTRPDSRDAPHLFGLGLAEQLADEITAELRDIRDDAEAAGCDPGAGNPLAADNVSQWSVQGGANGTIANNAGGGIRVTLNGTGWAIIDSAIVGPLTGINTTVQFKLTIPAGVPPWASIGIAISAPPTQNWAQFTMNPVPAPVAGGNTITFTLPTAVRNALNNNPNASVHIIVQGNVGQQYVFNDIVMSTGVPGNGCPLVVPLTSKGVNYGTISVDENHVVSTAGVVGVNTDLRVRPFFAEGTTISIREFLVGAFNAEMGIQINDPIINTAAAGGTVITPSGMVLDGTQDVFEASPTPEATDPSVAEPSGPGLPPDAGVALADFMEFYLLNYFKPGHYVETANAVSGRALFNQIGCNSCHIANMTINSDRRVADVETDHRSVIPVAQRPPEGVFNNLFAVASTRFVVVPESADVNGFPIIAPAGEAFVVEDIFTDFKRHNMGTQLHERNFNNSMHTTFITEPLWGVGSSPPYGHDGRAINLNEIILRHGGEGLTARNAYVALSASQKNLVQEFLSTLILFPPDDTASNLNVAGDIDATNPDFPQRAHGNIRLPTLFQIASEGAE